MTIVLTYSGTNPVCQALAGSYQLQKIAPTPGGCLGQTVFGQTMAYAGGSGVISGTPVIVWRYMLPTPVATGQGNWQIVALEMCALVNCDYPYAAVRIVAQNGTGGVYDTAACLALGSWTGTTYLSTLVAGADLGLMIGGTLIAVIGWPPYTCTGDVGDDGYILPCTMGIEINPTGPTPQCCQDIRWTDGATSLALTLSCPGGGSGATMVLTMVQTQPGQWEYYSLSGNGNLQCNFGSTLIKFDANWNAATCTLSFFGGIYGFIPTPGSALANCMNAIVLGAGNCYTSAYVYQGSTAYSSNNPLQIPVTGPEPCQQLSAATSRATRILAGSRFRSSI